MIAKEGLPALRRRHPSPRHVLCDRGLSDVDAELEQFAVYPRSAPKRVRDTHLANELPWALRTGIDETAALILQGFLDGVSKKTANVRRCRRPATARSGFPAPKGSEAGTVPAQQRLRPYNLQSVQHPGRQAIERDKQ